MHLIWHKWLVGRHRRRKIALLDLVEIFLCQTHTRNLWVGIYYTWNSIICDTLQWQLLEHTTYSHLCLTASHMRQHNLTCHIACRIDILQVRAHKLVHYDTPTKHLQIAQGIQSLHIGTTAHRYQDVFCFVFTTGCHHLIALQLSHPRVCQNLYTCLAVFLQKDGHHLLI